MKHIPLVVVCGIIIALAIIVFLPMARGANDTYAGNLVFNTEAEYLTFKEEVIKVNATWGAPNDKMEMLASTPPIIVEFRVSVSRAYDFSYGSKSEPYKEAIFLVFFLMAMALAVTTAVHFQVGAGYKAKS